MTHTNSVQEESWLLVHTVYFNKFYSNLHWTKKLWFSASNETVPAWNFQSHWNAFYYETCISLLKIHRFAMICVGCVSIRCKVELSCRSHPHNSTTMSHTSLCLFHTLFFKNRPYLSQQRLCHLTFLLCFMYTNIYHSLCTCVDFTYNAVDFLNS